MREKQRGTAKGGCMTKSNVKLKELLQVPIKLMI